MHFCFIMIINVTTTCKCRMHRSKRPPYMAFSKVEQNLHFWPSLCNSCATPPVPQRHFVRQIMLCMCRSDVGLSAVRYPEACPKMSRQFVGGTFLDSLNRLVLTLHLSTFNLLLSSLTQAFHCTHSVTLKNHLQTQQPSLNRLQPPIAAILELRNILADSLSEFIEKIFRGVKWFSLLTD